MNKSWLKIEVRGIKQRGRKILAFNYLNVNNGVCNALPRYKAFVFLDYWLVDEMWMIVAVAEELKQLGSNRSNDWKPPMTC